MNIQNLAMKFQIDENSVAPYAEDRFYQICSFHLGEEGQRKMEQAAQKVRDRLREQMEIRGTVSFWQKPVLEGPVLYLDNTVVRCDYFSQLPLGCVKGVFTYLVTIGDVDQEGESYIMTELYHDIWGTGYVEGAMKVLREDILPQMAEHFFPEEPVYLSEPFGPGYFGMAMDESKNIFPLTDSAGIGVIQKSSGLLLPEKSCLGLVLVYDRDYIKGPKACQTCIGGKGGCQFCEKRHIKEIQ